MKKNYKRVPFTIGLAKKIQSGEVEGRVITFNNRYPVRILAFDLKNKKHSIVAALTLNAGEEIVEEYNELGKCSDYLEGSENINLYIELPEEIAEKEEFHGIDGADFVSYERRKSKEQKLKNKFKIGDKVQVNGSEMVFEIYKIEGKDVLLKDPKEIMLGSYRYTLNDLRLPIEKYEFKAGDKVKFAGNEKVLEIVNIEGECAKLVDADLKTTYVGRLDTLYPVIPNHEFKPFDKVLVIKRPLKDEVVYEPSMFCKYVWLDGRLFVKTINHEFIRLSDILPYEGNEHLVGTTDNHE